MQVARREAGGEALMTLTVDSAVEPETLTRVAAAIGATASSSVDLTD
jgi:D-3-phosphoglycerate dehydrogenase